MQAELYSLIASKLTEDVCHLSEHFQVDRHQALNILDSNKDLNMLSRGKKTAQLDTTQRCQARVWNQGKGGQCSRGKTEGSDFCQTHAGLKYPKWCKGCFIEFKKDCFHKYVWEHLGRITDPPPSCFEYALSHQKKNKGK